MRIIAGKHRGRRLKSPRGWPARPTGDRVREATFDLLLHGEGALEMEGIHVVDVFAGTGAFGLEALSRGAGHAIFVDSDPRAADTIQDNATSLDEAAHATVLRRDARRPGAPPEVVATGCGLAFFDPPYDHDLLAPALSVFAKNRWFAPDAIAVTEMGKDDAFEPPRPFTIAKERCYGRTRIVILNYAPRT